MDARRVVAGAAACTLIAACGGGRPAIERVAPAERTYLIVTNRNWADVTIFSTRGTTQRRIGSVSALSTRTLLLPRSAMPDGTVRLLLDPLGSDKAHRTEVIAVSPGQHVELRVMPAMAMTTFAVRALHGRGLERDPR